MAVIETTRKPSGHNATGSASGGILSLLYRAEVRSVIYQVLLVVGVAALAWMIVSNTAANLKKQNIASGFDFLGRTAGFDISQSLIPFVNSNSYMQAFWVGLWNTVLVAVIGIVFATLLGFVMGIARLSSNWLVARLSTAYVEVLRNLPLLLQLFIWYFGVLKSLPEPVKRTDGVVVSTSVEFPFGAKLNVRGLYLPKPEWLDGSGMVLWTLIAGVLATAGIGWWARQRRIATGQPFPMLWTGLALCVALPILAFVIMGRPVQFEYPELGRFNLSGGFVVQPEFVALMVGLTVYTSAFIAEIVRAGILGVPKGQKEAARAIGLTNGQVLRFVVIPQAMRIIIPPLTSNYLNLTKNSSLGIAIGYPDLVSVGGTILNQTGQAVEMILMTMGVYLALSLITSGFMNWFNAKMALVER